MKRELEANLFFFTEMKNVLLVVGRLINLITEDELNHNYCLEKIVIFKTFLSWMIMLCWFRFLFAFLDTIFFRLNESGACLTKLRSLQIKFHTL